MSHEDLRHIYPPMEDGEAALVLAFPPELWSWNCTAKPPCPHSAIFHDIEEPGDPFPVCCAEGCGCGHIQGPMPEGVLPSWASFWERLPPIQMVRGGLNFPPIVVAADYPGAPELVEILNEATRRLAVGLDIDPALLLPHNPGGDMEQRGQQMVPSARIPEPATEPPFPPVPPKAERGHELIWQTVAQVNARQNKQAQELERLVSRVTELEGRLASAPRRPSRVWQISGWDDHNGDRWRRIGKSELVTDGHARPFTLTLAEVEQQVGPLIPREVDDLPALLAELEQAWGGAT